MENGRFESDENGKWALGAAESGKWEVYLFPFSSASPQGAARYRCGRIRAVISMHTSMRDCISKAATQMQTLTTRTYTHQIRTVPCDSSAAAKLKHGACTDFP